MRGGTGGDSDGIGDREEERGNVFRGFGLEVCVLGESPYTLFLSLPLYA